MMKSPLIVTLQHGECNSAIPFVIFTSFYDHGLQHIVGMEQQYDLTLQEQGELLKQHIKELRSKYPTENCPIVFATEGNFGCTAQYFEHVLRTFQNIKTVRDKGQVGVHKFASVLSWMTKVSKGFVEDEKLVPTSSSDIVCTHEPEKTVDLWWEQYHQFVKHETHYRALPAMIECWIMNIWVHQSLQNHTITTVPVKSDII